MKTVNKKRVAATPRARTGRRGVHKPKPNADTRLKELCDAINAEEVRRFAAIIEKHGKSVVVVVVFSSVEIEALKVLAEYEGSTVEDYIKVATNAVLESGLDTLRFDLREMKKGGAR